MEEFAIRRIWRVAEQYLQEGTLPRQWQLIVRANAYRHREIASVRDAIKVAMKMLNAGVTGVKHDIASCQFSDSKHRLLVLPKLRLKNRTISNILNLYQHMISASSIRTSREV